MIVYKIRRKSDGKYVDRGYGPPHTSEGSCFKHISVCKTKMRKQNLTRDKYEIVAFEIKEIGVVE